MLFIGRTMNKETQLGSKEKGGGRERREKKRAIHRAVHITRGISPTSQHRFSVNVPGVLRVFPH